MRRTIKRKYKKVVPSEVRESVFQARAGVPLSRYVAFDSLFQGVLLQIPWRSWRGDRQLGIYGQLDAVSRKRQQNVHIDVVVLRGAIAPPIRTRHRHCPDVGFRVRI